MAKKTKTGSPQRSKEEQWRKRMAAQATRPAGGALVEPDEDADTQDAPVGETTTYTVAPSRTAIAQRNTSPTPATTVEASTATAARTPGTTAAAAQRRAQAATRTARARIASTIMSVEDEMHYVRSDIRRLIILTAICFAVLIILSFLIK